MQTGITVEELIGALSEKADPKSEVWFYPSSGPFVMLSVMSRPEFGPVVLSIHIEKRIPVVKPKSLLAKVEG